MLEEFFLETPQGTLNVAKGPPAGPLLILLHGFTNRWQTFLPVMPALLGNWQVITFDHCGHGRSIRVPGGYTAAGFFEDAETVLNYALGSSTTDRSAILLGHSMGGSLALHLAQTHPEKVRAVVTGDTSIDLTIHIKIMNSRRNTRLFGLRRKLAGHPLDELLRRGLSTDQAEEMATLDPHVMDYHAEANVEAFFEDIQDVDFGKIRCPLLLTQANPEKGGLLQDAEILPVLAAHPQFHFQRFNCGHDLKIWQGPHSPFIKAALSFINHLGAS